MLQMALESQAWIVHKLLERITTRDHSNYSTAGMYDVTIYCCQRELCIVLSTIEGWRCVLPPEMRSYLVKLRNVGMVMVGFVILALNI